MAKLWVDNAIMVLVCLFTVGGVLRGVRQEVYSLLLWLAGIVTGWFFSQNFAIFLVKTITSPNLRLAASFTLLFLLTLAVGAIIKLLFEGNAEKRKLRIMERIGGILLGSVRGFMTVFVFVLIAGLTPLPKDRWWRESIYIPPVQAVIEAIMAKSSSRLARSINYS